MIHGTLAPILRELGAELLKRDMSIQKLNRCYVIKSSGTMEMRMPMNASSTRVTPGCCIPDYPNQRTRAATARSLLGELDPWPRSFQVASQVGKRTKPGVFEIRVGKESRLQSADWATKELPKQTAAREPDKRAQELHLPGVGGWESCGEAAMIAEREQAVVLVVCVLLRAAALPAPCFCAAHPLFSSRPPLRDDTSSSPSSLQRPSFS